MAKKKPYRFVLYLFARAIAGIFTLLPRPAALAFASGAGKAAFHLVSRHRERTIANLQAAFGSEKSAAEIHVIAKRVFENLALIAVDLLYFPKFSREEFKKQVDPGEGYKIYNELLAEGKGLISITGHIGNWELLVGAMTAYGDYPHVVLVRRIYYEPYNRWILNLRRAMRVNTVYRDESSRELLKALSENKVAGIVPDQDVDSIRGVFVSFFGRPAYTPVAPVRLALSSGAPILPNFLIRVGRDRYKVIVGKVIRPVIQTNREAAVQKYTEEWMRQFEEVIRQYPDQWVWMHNRWKTQYQEKMEGVQQTL